MYLIPNAVLKTGPTEEAVNLAVVKQFLRLDGTADDLALVVMVNAATSLVEQYISRKLINQTWLIYLDDYPYTQSEAWWDGVREGAIGEMRKSYPFIELPFGPLRAVTSINSIDESGNVVAFDAGAWQADLQTNRIGLRTGQTWPLVQLQPMGGVVIEVELGFGSQTDIPKDIQQALLLIVSKLYENRGDETQGEFFGTSGFTIPNTAQLLLLPYVGYRVG